MTNSTIIKSRITYGIAFLIWLTTVIAAYYYVHKPFSIEVAFGLLIAAWRMAVAFTIILIAGGVGRKLINFELEMPNLLINVMQIAIGLGVISIIILLLGTIIGVNVTVFGGFIAFMAFYVRSEMLVHIQTWKELITHWQQSDPTYKILGVSICFTLFATLLIALAPPLQFDSLTYHLAIPQYYLQNGRISFLPDNMFWGMPEQTEMVYLLAMSFGGIESATVLSWLIGLLTLIGLHDYSSYRFGIRAGWITVLSILVGYSFLDLLPTGYVEWPVMLFGLGFVASMDIFNLKRDNKSLLLVGGFAGMALGTKYTAGILIIIGWISIILLNNNLKVALVKCLKISVISLAAMSPWLIKNTVATGNPFYPLLFPTYQMDSLRLFHYQVHAPFGNFLDSLILPWQSTIWGARGKVGYSASIGPVLLGLSPLSIIGLKTFSISRKNTVKISAIITIAGFIIWITASRLSGLLIQSRLYFAIFPAWALLSGAGFAALIKLKNATVRFDRIAVVLIIIVWSFSFLEIILYTHDLNPAGAILGIQTKEDYMIKNLGGYGRAVEVMQGLNPNSRVIMLWETRGLYCQPICDSDEVIDRWFHDVRIYLQPDKIISNWKSHGFTHMLLHNQGAKFIEANDERYTTNDWKTLENLRGQLVLLKSLNDIYFLYELP